MTARAPIRILALNRRSKGRRVLELLRELGPETLRDCYDIDPDCPGELDIAILDYLAACGVTP